MLEVLAKNDKLWRSYALKICGCKETADDLVQDMYLKLANHKKEISNIFIYQTLRSIFIDQKRKQKKHCNLDLHLRYIEKKNDNERLDNRYELLDILKEVGFFEREVLLLTHEFSLREAEKESDVPYYTLNYYKKKSLEVLKSKYGK